MISSTRFDEGLFDDSQANHSQLSSAYPTTVSNRNHRPPVAIALLVGSIASFLLLAYAIWCRTQLYLTSQYSILSQRQEKSGQPVMYGKSGQNSAEDDCQPAKRITSAPINGQFLQSQYYSLKYRASKFNPPALIWIYSEGEPTYLQQLNRKAIFRHAAQGNYTVKIVDRTNYTEYFLWQVVDEIQNSIERAQNRKQAFYYPTQNAEYVKLVIVLALLEQYGGIYIEDTLTVIEPLRWLQEIHEQIYVNLIDRQMPVRFFGFHDVTRSSLLVRPIFRGIQVQQYVRIFPALVSSFMAAEKRTPFISLLNRQFRQLLSVEGDNLLKLLSSFTLQKWQYVYSYDSHTRGNLFSIASYLVLNQKQKQYDALGPNSKFFAIDYFGVRSINKLYFASKLEMVMDWRTANNTYYHLARVGLEELLSMTGPLRYMVALEPRKEMNQLLLRAKQGDNLRHIYKDSFLHKYLFPDHNQSWIVDSGLSNSGEEGLAGQWQSLPRQVWVFWGSGLNESTLTHQLCTRRIRSICQSSNFTYNQVTKANLHLFLQNQTIDLINSTLTFSKHKIYEQTYSDFVRLFLLKRHGGIYMDASFLLIEPLSWLLNITNYPKRYVYNRYGQHPTAFMFFNPQYATNIYQTQIDTRHNTRNYWHLAYENNFIAAEKDSLLIRDWIEEFILYHNLEHSQIKDRFKGCGVGQQVWSNQKWPYLYQMDAIKCLLGRKHIQLAKTSTTLQIEAQNQDKGQRENRYQQLGEGNHVGLSQVAKYYGIWSINGYNGVQRLRTFTNFQNPNSQNNLFAALYSTRYVRQVMGYPRELVKFFGFGSRQLARLIFSRQKDIEPDSIVGQHLIKYRGADEYIKIIKEQPVLVKLSDQ